MDDSTLMPTDRVSHWMITATRIAVGVLWLTNSGWKTPTDFSALRGFAKEGVDHPVFPPFSWALKHLVLTHMTAFGFATLFIEVSLAALLLLGWKTRVVSLVGAAQSVAIGLSVANAPGEWPWSYVLMVAVHLLLFATAAGRFGGLDGSLARREWRTPALVIGIVATVVGLWSAVNAGDKGMILDVSRQIYLFRSTVSGGLVLAGIGLVAVVVAAIRQPRLLLVPAALAGVFALATLLLWRPSGYPWGLGYNGTALAALLAVAVGLGLLARAGMMAAEPE